ncbi:MAG: N-acetyltransferase [Microbacteriaceae bacterium]|nr:N-acetyltransferase [Microbacteriaceae bacterium]
MATEFRHDPDAHRYTMHVDGQLVSTAEYLDHGAGIVFHRTVTVPMYRGRGYADQLVSYAMDDVEAREAGPVRATCWYVSEWFGRHPERGDLLAS